MMLFPYIVLQIGKKSLICDYSLYWLFKSCIRDLPLLLSSFILSLKRPGAALRFLSWQRATFPIPESPSKPSEIMAKQFKLYPHGLLKKHSRNFQGCFSQTQVNWTNGALTCCRGYFFNGGWQSNLGWSPQTLTSFSLALHCYTYHSFILSIPFHRGCCVYLFNSSNLLSLAKSLQF